jgi:putative membrane protein
MMSATMPLDYFQMLWFGFALIWLILAIRPHDRRVWLAENVLTVISVAVLMATYARWPLSHVSYTLIVIFLALHTIGSHYTYVRVPYDEVIRSLLGLEINRSFGWLRNHYDRLVHLAYGLLLAYPFFELLERYAAPAPGWSYVLSPALIMATSMIFEVLEWWATIILGDGAGAAYLGSQGDEWDAQKDMALAALGSMITMIYIAVI